MDFSKCQVSIQKFFQSQSKSNLINSTLNDEYIDLLLSELNRENCNTVALDLIDYQGHSLSTP